MKFLSTIVLIALTGLVLLAGTGGADERNLDYPHNSTNNINCWTCHYTASTSVVDWETVPLDIDDTPWNRLCWSCHNTTDAIYVKNHSSSVTDSLNYTWPTAAISDTGIPISTVECRTCHYPHHQLQTRVIGDWNIATFNSASSLYSGTVSAIDTTTVTVTGAGWTDDRWAGYVVVPNTSNAALSPNGQYFSYNYKIISNTTDTLTVAGPIDSGLTAGSTMAIYYGKLIRAQIVTPNSGTKAVKFYDKSGANSFADGDGTRDGVCEVCHTQTNHFRNDGSASEQLHENLFGKQETNCMDCHKHTKGFGHGGGRKCVDCHGHDAGTAYDWDMTTPYAPLQDVDYDLATSIGAGTSHSHSTHTETDSDDAKGPALYCDGCHDITKMPSFNSGTDIDLDGRISLAETDVCDTCHSKNGPYNGVDDPTIGAKANWAGGIYEDDGVTLQSGKEKWCVTCHGENPSIIEGISAPNVLGDENGAYTYGTGWGFYKTGHGLDKGEDYPASGGLTPGAGKGCVDCHDVLQGHIDGQARSYDCTDDDPDNDDLLADDDCNSDEYRQGYRLQLVDDQDPMTMPLYSVVSLSQENYRLCFSSTGCHLPEKYLLPETTYGSNFRDDLGWVPGTDHPFNAHKYHLSMAFRFRSDWRATTRATSITCTACHNVHGSNQLAMIRDGKLVNREPGMEILYTDTEELYPDAALGPIAANAEVYPNQPVTLADSTGTFWDSDTSDNFCADCHGNPNGGGYIYPRSSNPLPQEPPTLSWTGESGYEATGVNPESGPSGVYFAFRVKYTDANFDLPTVIQVWVDLDDSGSYEDNEKYDLVEAVTSDRNCSDGKLYNQTMAINFAGDGTLSYRFYAEDRNAVATGDAVIGSTIELVSSVPVLSWSSEPGYAADGVTPDSGGSGSSFVFRIDYSDADNTSPTNIQVWVDVDDSGSYGAGEKYEMTEVDAGDTTYTDGKLYSKALSLSSAGDGSLSYRFYAVNGAGDATGTPTVDHSVNVTSSNTAPTLAWTGAVNYVADGVDPDAGVTNTDFTFQVQYSDADNNPPSFMQVWVDMNDDDDYDDVGEKIDLTAVDASDTDYSNGKIYEATTSLAAVGDSYMNYRFSASDGTVEATGTPAQDSIVTLLVNARRVSCGGTGDYDYTSLQAAIDDADNGDTILLASGTCTENITIDNKDVTIMSSAGSGSTFINGNAAGRTFTITNGSDIVLNGVTVQNGYISSGYGGGIYISDSSPTIVNSLVTGNHSQYAGAIYVTGASSTVTITDTTVSSNTSSLHGPGIYLLNGGSAVISGSTISNNSTPIGSGGGICMGASIDASLSISDSTISGNSVSSLGGGISIGASGGTVSLNIDGSTISGNSSQQGGGIYITDTGATFTGTISDSTFSSNSSTLNGGAMTLLALDSMTITGSTFSDNTSVSGGGIHVGNGAGNIFTISDSTIRDNNSTGSGYGGGLRLGGGTATIERCFFIGNSSRQGGGLYIAGNTTASIISCAVAGNSAYSFDGGGFFLSGQDAVLVADIVNCTISGNDAATSGGGVSVAYDATATVTVTNSIIYDNGGSNQINGAVTVSYSDIGEDGYSGNNNINVDPLFVDPRSYSLVPTSEGDYHLQASSQALNSGTSVGAPDSDIDNDIRPNGTGYDMGADEIKFVFNNSPGLEWTGETGYGADGVAPDQGASGAGFEFHVTYVDVDNDAPSVIQLWVDENDNNIYESGEKYDMSAVDGGDTTYSDGKLYTKSLNLVYAGDDELNYRFYAADSYDVAGGEPVTDNSVFINSVPQLAWLGSGDYVADGANPDSGLVGSDFIFRVSYTDAHNTSPTSIQLWVDRNDDGDYVDSGEMLTMTPLSSADTDYTDGRTYTRTVAFDKAGDNTLNYRFYAANGAVATGNPTTVINTVTLVNNIPTLDWTGLSNYTDDGVDPDYDLGGSTYDFQVKYTDGDNEPPASIQLWLDKNDDGDYLDADEKIDMSAVDPGDTTYSDGKLYKVEINLAAVADGFLNYSFRAGDGTDTATGAPTSDLTVGVFTAHPAPELDWAGESGFTADGVDPDSGPGGGLYTFQVKYTQLLNSAPTVIQVWVDKDDDGDYLDAGEKIDLIEVDGDDTTYNDGKLYTAATIVPYVADGSVSYLFYAHDGTDAATGGAIVEQTLTVVDAIEVPVEVATIQAAINAAVDGQIILVASGTYSENIIFPTDKSVTVQSVYGDLDTTIQGSGANAPVVDISAPEAFSPVLDGFTIDNQAENTLTRGIYVDNLSAPTIKNCIIQGNVSTNNSGGGLYLQGASSTTATTLLNTTISGNTANYGGCLRCTNSKLVISGCTISSNTATQNGGGLYLDGASTTVTIGNSTLTGSSGRSGGALYATGIGALTISGSTFDANTATTGTGGGLYVINMTDVTTLTNTMVINNASNSSAGGIYFSSPGTSLTITDSTFENNTVTLYDGGGILLSGDATTNVTLSGGSLSGNVARGGGGIYLVNGPSLVVTDVDIYGNQSRSSGGGISVGAGCSLDISGSYLRGNQSGSGGGGISAGGTVTLTNCIVSGNSADGQTYSDGGGITSSGILNAYNSSISGNYARRLGGGLRSTGTSTVINSIIWGNTAGSSGANISGTPTVTYSDVEGGYAGTGNIDGNPRFVDFQQAGLGGPTSGGVFLLCNGVDDPAGCTSASACIDFSSATSAPGDDIKGDSRPYDVEGIGDGVDDYDMGADEYIPSVNNLPVLAWTGEANYTADGIDPDSGMGTDEFVFRISYADSDNDPASSVQVWLDVDDSGTYEASEKFAMSAADTGDLTYSDGKLYTRTLAIDYAGDGTLDYRFYAADGAAVSISAPTSTSTVTVTDPHYYTTVGTATAVVSSGTSIAVSMPYTDDLNGDNTYTVEYKLDAAVDWIVWGTNPEAHVVSPYTDTITGLTLGETYDVRLTYNDADEVIGINPQEINGILMVD